MLDGRLDIDALRAKSDDEVCKELVRPPGIGVWTAEMLMLFSMQRPNILSCDDLAIRPADKTFTPIRCRNILTIKRAVKWNKIERRMLRHITANRRGEIDEGSYVTGKKISDEKMDSLAITHNIFRGDWDYKISPQKTRGVHVIFARLLSASIFQRSDLRADCYFPHGAGAGVRVTLRRFAIYVK